MRIQPDDVILVHVDRRITVEQAEAIQGSVAPLFPGHEVAILPPDVELRAVEKAAADAVLARVRGAKP